MPNPRPTPPMAQAGVTLIEVMIGMLLIGLLVVGVNGLWAIVGRSFEDAWLRQKAVFRINGEMERLSSLYITGTGPSQTETVNDYATTGAPARVGSYIGSTVTGTRRIYGRNQGGTVLMTDDPAVFETALLADGSNLNTVYRRIYYYDPGTTPTDDDRNFVWLDRENSVVAQVSWEVLPLQNTGNGGTNACYDDSPCRLLTLYLDYPFRYSPGNPRGDMGPVETITLQTIVGQRR